MIIRQVSVLPESDRVAAVSAQAPQIQQIVFEWRRIPQWRTSSRWTGLLPRLDIPHIRSIDGRKDPGSPSAVASEWMVRGPGLGLQGQMIHRAACEAVLCS